MTRSAEWEEYITSDPQILVGKPTIKGTRISVELIMELIEQGWTFETILEAYPHLRREQIRAAVAYAIDLLRDDQVLPLASRSAS